MPGADAAHSVLALPQGGGAQQGLGETFTADLHTGTGRFAVPLTIPPGRNGFQPSLTLDYNTGYGNGAFGMGWDLGIPVISRKSDQGIPRYRDDAVDVGERDTFVLSGAEDLVFVGRVNDEAGIAVDRYRPRTEGLFAEIFRYRDPARGVDSWRVGTKDGLVSFFGSEPVASPDPAVTSRPGRPGDIFEWCLTLTLDPFGNRIEYRYEADAGDERGHTWHRPQLAQIRYADHGPREHPEFLAVVAFDYEARPDPSSSCRAGFEIRTSGRCRGIRVETHTDRVRPVRGYEFSYRQDSLTALSLLVGIGVVGFDDAGTASRPMPPLEFDYTDFDPQDRRRRTFSAVNGTSLPTSALTDPSLELVDLFGCGLPDFLQMSDSSVRFWRNRGAGRFAPPRPMSAAPPESLGAAGVQLIDADGDGRTDLLVTRQGVNGYYPLQFGGAWDRRSFQPYAAPPSFDLQDPQVHLVDLTGDGVSDVIRAGSRLESYFNNPRDGWQAQPAYAAERGRLEDFPDVTFSDPRVKWADFTGDGLQDIALVHDGTVEYWPNHGYGRWGHRVGMATPPRFPVRYDPRRILIGDVNGDGLADIVYVDDRTISLWINQSGNAWSERIEIPGTPPVSDLDSLRLVDLLGTGVAGVLWTKDAHRADEEHYFFLDLTGGVKPLLLTEVDNNLGAVTRIGYASSTQFFLEDERRAATRWQTPLPFPVQVVARIEVIDEISGGKLTSEYRYHGGYWDGVDREYRGFSCVEQLDSESFDSYRRPGLHGAGVDFAAVEQQRFSPPRLTRSWFHQGPVGDARSGLEEVEHEGAYWSGDSPQLGHAAGVTAVLAQLRQRYAGLTSRERRRIERDALRSLRGSLLRTEVFGLDGSGGQDRPYTVTEYAYGVREESPEPGPTARHRVFFPMALRRRTTQWERGDDPLSTLTYTGDHDEHGNVLTSIDVACPRGWRTLADAVGAVGTAGYLATTTRTQMATPAAATYIHDRAARVAQYEILTPPVAANAGPGRTVTDVLALANDPINLRIVAESLHFFDADPALADNGAFVGLPYGVLGRYGAITRSESLQLTETLAEAAYPGGRPPYLRPGQPFVADAGYPAAFVAQLAPLAGYVHHPATGPYAGGFYTTGLRRRFDFHGSGVARGLVLETLDGLGARSTIEYDHPYALLPTTVTDAAGLVVRASNDYRVLQPGEITDPNGNRTAVTFSPAGAVTAVFVRGKAGQGEGDATRASVMFEHDLRSKPARIRTLRSEHHDSDPADSGAMLESWDYVDGFGRVVQTRGRADRVHFGDLTGGGESILPALQSGGRGATVQGIEPDDATGAHWIVSGWTAYDNKGQAVEHHEPFFATSSAYSRRQDADPDAMVSTYYDALGRVLRTVNPDGCERTTVYGTPVSLEDPTQVSPTPWERTTYDPNDNGGRTHPSASSPYRHHWNTPTTTVLDALGRAVETIVRTREEPGAPGAALPALQEYRTRSAYDIQGNLVRLTDALNRDAQTYVYDLARRPLRRTSIDAGVHTSVFDALGNEIQHDDAKGARTLRSCDRLRRPDRVWARNRPDQPVTLRQRTIFGDGGTANQSAAARSQARAANQLARPVRQLDEAGEITFAGYDFKGNIATATRRVIADSELIAAMSSPTTAARAFAVDWDQPPALTGSYETSYTYDALNRVRSIHCPLDVDGVRRTLVPGYSSTGALESIRIDDEVVVERIVANARGQRVLVVYGNGLMTRCAYDPQTLRLVRMRTEAFTAGELSYAPQGPPLQDLAYEYDLAGNTRRITEQTPGCGVRNNAQAGLHPSLQVQIAAGDALVREFAYDPLHRLISATGREADNLPAGSRPWADAHRTGFDWGGPGTPAPETARDSTRTYRETFSYDAADNLLAVRHGTWTRSFGMSGSSAASWDQAWREHVGSAAAWTTAASNHLTHLGYQTDAAQSHFYDANGNLVRQSSERHFAWDAQDRMVAFANRTAGANASIEAAYLYDPSGQRVKKLVRKGPIVEVTVYIDGVFEHRIVGAAENSVLQVLDDGGRIATIRAGGPLQGDTGPPVQYHLADHLGSSTTVVGGTDLGARTFLNREEYFAFGETSFGSYGRKRYRFCGKERDEESGLCYFGARYLSAPACRWISTDWITSVGPRSNPYVAFRDNPLTYVDPDGQFSVTNHATYTRSAARSLGYDETSAEFIAHFASVYADHAEMGYVVLNNVTKTGERSDSTYHAYIDYSPTAKSQDTSSPINSSWHGMAADNETISAAAAVRRGQEFGWSKILAAGTAFKGLRQRQIVYQPGKGYVIQQRTLSQIVRSNQSVLGDLGQGIHALQDSIRHKGVDFAHHDAVADQYPPAGEDTTATAAAYNGLLVFELMSGDPRHLELLKTTKIDVSTATAAQVEAIKTAAQAVLDRAEPDPNLVIRLNTAGGEIELRQHPAAKGSPDAGSPAKKPAHRKR